MEKRLPLFIALWLLLCLYGSGLAQNLPFLFAKTGMRKQGAAPSTKMENRIRVNVDFFLMEGSAGSKPADRMQAVLPDKTVTITKRKVEVRGEENYTWFGKVEGRQFSLVVLSVVKGVMYGVIDIDLDTYSIAPKEGGYLITKQDKTKAAPFDGEPIYPPKKKGPRSNAPLNAPAMNGADDGSVITVLAVYTQAMQTKYGSGIDALIQNFIDVGNAAYDNSGITTQLSLTQSQVYLDSGAAEGVDNVTALTYIVAEATLQTLRNTYATDMVSLLRVYSGSGNCGYGYTMDSTFLGSQMAPWAYSIVEVLPSDEANPQYCHEITLVHELGHNMGAQHDRAQESGDTGAYPYSHGYIETGQFATIMAYGSPTVSYFSNPDVSYSGFATGITGGTDGSDNSATSADNARTINNTKTVVAAFRDSTAAIPTLTEWGIIFLATLMLAAGVYYGRTMVSHLDI